MATPATVGGKVFLLVYGLLGCSSSLLFFNLFLERLITAIAHVSGRRGARGPGRAAPGRPSARAVLLALGAASLALCCGAAALDAAAEGWGYRDALYFCFVAFSTIGLGDLVSGQRARYAGQGLYRVANFVLLLAGVCCLYSLFDVASVLVRQAVDWALGRAAGAGCGSGEAVSMKGVLAAGKASLAVAQEPLPGAAGGRPRRASAPPADDEFSGGVGAFAVMNGRLAETSARR